MSPLATDFKFYYDHAAYTESVSSEAAYTAAGTPTAFQKTVATESEMTTAAKALTVVDDYYFRINLGYRYVKVVVTSDYVESPKTNAVYTTEEIDEKDYTGSLTATDDADMKSKADVLTEGTYYYKVNTLSRGERRQARVLTRKGLMELTYTFSITSGTVTTI